MTAQDVPYRVTWWGMALLLVSLVQSFNSNDQYVFSETAVCFGEPGGMIKRNC